MLKADADIQRLRVLSANIYVWGRHDQEQQDCSVLDALVLSLLK